MATQVREIDVIIKLQDQMTAGLKLMSADTKKFGEQLMSAGTKLTAAGAAGSLAITGMMKLTADFDQGLSNVSTLLSAEAMPMMDSYREGILKLGTEVPVSLNGLNEALYQVVSATGDAEGAMQILESSARLGVAGIGSTTDAVNLVTSAMNSFGYAAEDTDKIANIVFKTVKAGKTDVAKLAKSFGQVAPLAAELGVSFEELQAATAALTTTGMETSVAQAQIRAGMASLLKPTEDAKKLFDKLGVESFSELIKKSGGMVGAFEKIKGAAAGNEEVFGKAMGSVEGLSAALALTGPVAGKFKAALTDMKSGTDALSEAVQKQLKEMSAKAEMTWNNIKALIIEFGTTLEPTISAAMDIVNGFIDMMRSIPEPIKNALAEVGLAFTALAVVGGPILAAAGSLLVFKASLAAVGISLGAVLAPLGALILPIAAVGVALGTLYVIWKKWDDIKTMFKLIISSIYLKMKEWAAKAPVLFKIAIQKIIDAVTMIGPRLEKFWYTLTGQDAKASKIQDISNEMVKLGDEIRSIEDDYRRQAEAESDAILLADDHTEAVEGTTSATEKLIKAFSNTAASVGTLATKTEEYSNKAVPSINKVTEAVGETTKQINAQTEAIEKADWAVRNYGSQGWVATSSHIRTASEQAQIDIYNITNATEDAGDAAKLLGEDVIKASDTYKELEGKGRKALIGLWDETFNLKDQLAVMKEQLDDITQNGFGQMAEKGKAALRSLWDETFKLREEVARLEAGAGAAGGAGGGTGPTDRTGFIPLPQDWQIKKPVYSEDLKSESFFTGIAEQVAREQQEISDRRGTGGGDTIIYEDNRQTNFNRSQLIANDRTAMEQLNRQIDKKGGSSRGLAYDQFVNAARRA